MSRLLLFPGLLLLLTSCQTEQESRVQSMLKWSVEEDKVMSYSDLSHFLDFVGEAHFSNVMIREQMGEPIRLPADAGILNYLTIEHYEVCGIYHEQVDWAGRIGGTSIIHVKDLNPESIRTKLQGANYSDTLVEGTEIWMAPGPYETIFPGMYQSAAITIDAPNGFLVMGMKEELTRRIEARSAYEPDLRSNQSIAAILQEVDQAYSFSVEMDEAVWYSNLHAADLCRTIYDLHYRAQLPPDCESRFQEVLGIDTSSYHALHQPVVRFRAEYDAFSQVGLAYASQEEVAADFDTRIRMVEHGKNPKSKAPFAQLLKAEKKDHLMFFDMAPDKSVLYTKYDTYYGDYEVLDMAYALSPGTYPL